MTGRVVSVGVAEKIGRYSDAIEVPAGARMLFVSGTPGMKEDGSIPEGIEAQAEQAWKNVIAMLTKAGMGVEHIVKMTQYLTREADIQAYAKVRAKVLDGKLPASMLSVVPALVKPEIIFELEVIAAKAD